MPNIVESYYAAQVKGQPWILYNCLEKIAIGPTTVRTHSSYELENLTSPNHGFYILGHACKFVLRCKKCYELAPGQNLKTEIWSKIEIATYTRPIKMLCFVT